MPQWAWNSLGPGCPRDLGLRAMVEGLSDEGSATTTSNQLAGWRREGGSDNFRSHSSRFFRASRSMRRPLCTRSAPRRWDFFSLCLRFGLLFCPLLFLFLFISWIRLMHFAKFQRVCRMIIPALLPAALHIAPKTHRLGRRLFPTVLLPRCLGYLG